MKRGEFKTKFKETLSDMYTIMESKNSDYASNDNPFSNFTMVTAMGITTIEKGILVRMADKMSRIINLTERDAEVKDESINDTLVDLANYSIILKLYIESKSK